MNVSIPRELVYYVAGIGFLALAKAKYVVQGYSTPKPFPVSETDRCIDYDVSIVDLWIKLGASFHRKTVLELGPGSDLGIGLSLLSKGAQKYIAVDRHNLVDRVPESFYERFSQRFGVLPLAQARGTGEIRYLVSEDFDIQRVVPHTTVDLVVSNAAFEHFSDVAKVASDLFHVVKSGGRICAVIDLQTHSRWIRRVDPNNIYRYPEWLYGLFRFPGQPNRLRPVDYIRFFESAGWRDVSVEGLASFDSKGRGVAKRFARDEHLDLLSIVLRAERP